jgi:hypothetical protein
MRLFREFLLASALAAMAGSAAAAPTGRIETFDPVTLAATHQGFSTPSVAGGIAYYNNSLYAVLGDTTIAAYGLNGSLQVHPPIPGFKDVTTNNGALYTSIDGAGFGLGFLAGQTQINPSGFQISQINTPSLATGIAVTGANTAWMTFANGSLAEYDASQALVANPQFQPFAIFLDVTTDGANIYASIDETAFGSGYLIARILGIGSSSMSLSQIAVTVRPAASLLFANNDLYAALDNGTIDRFDLNGNLLASYSAPGRTFTDLAFGNGELFASATAPIPEPSTWALMLLGFGAIALRMRRRRPAVDALAHRRLPA